MVFRGRDGLDELTVSTESDVWWVRDGAVSTFALAPESVGVVRLSIEALRGGDTASNTAVVRAVLRGEPSAAREAVLLNAGAALATAAGTADGSASAEAVTAAIARGVREAAAAIDTGAAQETLTRWVEATQRVASA